MPAASAKKAYPTRSAIERIIAWTATQNGRRVRLRYLGTARNDGRAEGYGPGRAHRPGDPGRAGHGASAFVKW